MFHIHSLTVNDLEAADQVLMSAYQVPSRQAELERLVNMEGTTWKAGLENSQLVGMVGAIDYGPFAYIGMMGVHTDFQRRGYGKALMLALIESLEQAGQLCTLLDASDAGAPLYLQIGYSDLSLAHVFTQVSARDFQPPAMRIDLLEKTDLSEIADFDRSIFGADRSLVLRSYLSIYPGRLIGARSEQGQLLGYALAQGKRLGPWAATSPQAAAALFHAALQFDFKEPLEVLLPSPNLIGLELLQAAGFARQRSLRHMGRGITRYSRRLELIYGQSSFMLG